MPDGYNQFHHRNRVDDVLTRVYGDRYVCYRAVWDRATACEEVTDFPLHLVLEQRFTCDLACVHCVHGHQDLRTAHRYVGALSWETFQAIVDEAASYGCPSIQLNGRNEPLLHEDIAARARYCVERNILDVSLVTNGTHLHRDMIHALLESGITRIMVSLDAATAGTFAVVRGGDWDLVIHNLCELIDAKRRSGRDLPLIGVSFVRMALNVQEEKTFLDMWENEVDFLRVQTYMAPADDARFVGHYPAQRKPVDDFRCPQPFQRLVIHGDGYVLPCCSVEGDKLHMGKVPEQKLHAIWHSPAMDELRAAHREQRGREHAVCGPCIATWVGA